MTSDRRTVIVRGLVLAVILGAVLAGLEVTGVTDMGLWFALMFTVVFAAGWTVITGLRAGRP